MKVSSVTNPNLSRSFYKICQNGVNKDNKVQGDLWFNSFQLKGSLNSNYAYGSNGNDSFYLSGFMNRNVAFGNKGNNKFTVNNGMLNKNIVKGGIDDDLIRIARRGFSNKNFIDGGFGLNTVLFEGKKEDFKNISTNFGINFYHKLTRCSNYLKNIHKIKFSEYKIPEPNFKNNTFIA